MSKTVLIKKTIDNISLLPEQQIQEINDFAEFLLSRIQQEVLSKEVSDANITSNSYKFLEEEPDLYTVNDLKVQYGK
jgi:hypothetical protein